MMNQTFGWFKKIIMIVGTWLLFLFKLSNNKSNWYRPLLVQEEVENSETATSVFMHG